jgi:hypothetical protein
MSPAVNPNGNLVENHMRSSAARGVLPDEGDEQEAGAEAVFGIAGQSLAEDFFLVDQAKRKTEDQC